VLPIRPALDQLVDQLTAAGFRAHLDPAQLTIETVGVWVQPRTRTTMTLAGGGELTCWLYLIARNTDTLQVIDWLDDALAGVLELVALSDTADAVDLAAAVALPSAPSNILPAYRLTIDLDLIALEDTP
jgi:hypothetical protein